jgi:predicted dehydrogenase
MSGRVALIGYGLAGEAFHAPLIATAPDLDLAAVVTRDPERRAAASGRYPGVELLDSVEDISKYDRPAHGDLPVLARLHGAMTRCPNLRALR